MTSINQDTVLYIAAGILLVFAIVGYKKGFLQELYSIASIIVSIILSVVMIKNMTNFSSGQAYLATFLVIMFLIRWGGKLLNIVDHIPIIGGLNKMFGAILGLAKGLLILFVVYKCIGNILFPDFVIPHIKI